MIYSIQRSINDVNKFHSLVKSIHADLVGISYDGQTLTVEFTQDKTTAQIESIRTLVEPTKSQQQLIEEKLDNFKTKGAATLKKILAENTMQGLSTADSAHLFKKLRDAIGAIQEGALPTAYYLLDNELVDFVYTQARKDRYKQLILEAMQ